MANIALISFLKNSLNTRSLSSYLKANGHEVTCYFCHGGPGEKDLGALVASIKSKGVLLVGVSLVTDDYHSAVFVTNAIKRETGVPVVWGGAHVNVCPDECLRHADMICLGEGEEALLELADSVAGKKLNTSIRNLWFRVGDEIIKNEVRPLEEDLDKYPFPDFDLDSQYIVHEGVLEKIQESHFNGEYSIMTSRGCPYRCRYCYNNYRWQQYKGKGKYLRMRSIENVIEELSIAKAAFKGLKQINFWDDSFVARNINDFSLFKTLYLERINLPFFALIEPMAFHFEKVKLLKDCGLESLQVGIQSGSERVNKTIYNRPVSNEKNIEVAEYINKLGINVTYDLIFNNPYENNEDLLDTVKLLIQFPRPFTLQGFNLIFYPGTEITVEALRDGHIAIKPDFEDFSTIQSKANSPISMGGSAELSGRFYSVQYSSRDKEYLNSVISLMAYRHVPVEVIKYFSKPETFFKKIMLKLFISFYVMASRAKNSLMAGNNA